MIAVLGETTSTPYFIYRLRDAMLSDATGRRILRDRPRITSSSVSPARLRNLPDGSLGRAYADWLDREGVTADSREGVKYIDDEECAYVMQRYRESHDLLHALTGLPTVFEGEVALKAFEFANTLLPMTGLSTLAAVRLKPAERVRFRTTYLPWALRNGLASKELINVYWEEQLERNVADVRADLGIEQPADLRETRSRLRALKRQKQQEEQEKRKAQ
ncbi:MAG: Ubiquinone biosynthesis protein [Sarcosagium campestre]|nr:MAG: Ubiquinone biosynthesis protein [Sarcosagium campestre]